MTRSLFIALFALATAVAGMETVFAQVFPDRPLRIILGYPPGGGTDLVARLIQQPLSQRWGQPVVIDNRPGASAIIAGGTPQAFGEFIRGETAKFARIARAGNIAAE